MGNWIDELDEETREFDRQLREGAQRYDREVCGGNSGDDDEEEDEDED